MVGQATAEPHAVETGVEGLRADARRATNGAHEHEAAEAPADDKQVPEIVKAACRFAGARGKPAAVYLLGEGSQAQGTADTPITKRTVIQLAAALDETFTFKDLDLLIQSSGGDIHAAYQMMSLLRGRMTGEGELVACVPRRAQSSATLLCLGCDRIALDEPGG